MVIQTPSGDQLKDKTSLFISLIFIEIKNILHKTCRPRKAKYFTSLEIFLYDEPFTRHLIKHVSDNISLDGKLTFQNISHTVTFSSLERSHYLLIQCHKTLIFGAGLHTVIR
jgi:hypothetical protein